MAENLDLPKFSAMFISHIPFKNADDRNRTCTSETPDPKSGASASSATSAYYILPRNLAAAPPEFFGQTKNQTSLQLV